MSKLLPYAAGLTFGFVAVAVKEVAPRWIDGGLHQVGI